MPDPVYLYNFRQARVQGGVEDNYRVARGPYEARLRMSPVFIQHTGARHMTPVGVPEEL